MVEKRRIITTFAREKFTRRTVRFQELPTDTPSQVMEWDGETVAIGPLYIRNPALKSIGNPDRIRVTIEPLD